MNSPKAKNLPLESRANNFKWCIAMFKCCLLFVGNSWWNVYTMNKIYELGIKNPGLLQLSQRYLRPLGHLSKGANAIPREPFQFKASLKEIVKYCAVFYFSPCPGHLLAGLSFPPAPLCSCGSSGSCPRSVVELLTTPAKISSFSVAKLLLKY